MFYTHKLTCKLNLRNQFIRYKIIEIVSETCLTLTLNSVVSHDRWLFMIGRGNTQNFVNTIQVNCKCMCLAGLLWYQCVSFIVYPESHVLTLNVRGLSYLGLTRSISWLLMPWLPTSPGHQQPWYWLCGISSFLSYLRNDFNYLRRTNVEKWHKM